VQNDLLALKITNLENRVQAKRDMLLHWGFRKKGGDQPLSAQRSASGKKRKLRISQGHRKLQRRKGKTTPEESY